MNAASLKLAPAPSRSRAARKPRTAPTPDRLGAYATAGVVLMAVLSAGLNGYAHAQAASVTWAGWALGLVIPAIILLLSKVAGTLHRRGRLPLAYATAAAGVGLLVLSVWHCSTSIALLTGSPLALAVPMAIAIDLGFVCCELANLED